jgi:hypothetical protein
LVDNFTLPATHLAKKPSNTGFTWACSYQPKCSEKSYEFLSDFQIAEIAEQYF